MAIPNSTAVKGALKSFKLFSTGRCLNLSTIASVINAVKTANKILTKTPQPKNNANKKIPGSNATNTLNMILLTLFCGGKYGEVTHKDFMTYPPH
jgi:hypothetical protein